jgi:hypothetical protein
MRIQIKMIAHPSRYLKKPETEVCFVTKLKIWVSISYLLQDTLG